MFSNKANKTSEEKSVLNEVDALLDKMNIMLEKFRKMTNYKSYVFGKTYVSQQNNFQKLYEGYKELSSLIQDGNVLWSETSQYVRCNITNMAKSKLYMIYSEFEDNKEYEKDVEILNREELKNGSLVLTLKLKKDYEDEEIEYEYTQLYEASNWRYETYSKKRVYKLDESENAMFRKIGKFLSKNELKWIDEVIK